MKPASSALQVDSLLLSYQERKKVKLLSHVQLFATPQTSASQAPLSITNSWSLPKLVSIELVTPSNHLILCNSLLLLPSIFPNIFHLSSDSPAVSSPGCWALDLHTGVGLVSLVSAGPPRQGSEDRTPSHRLEQAVPAAHHCLVSSGRVADVTSLSSFIIGKWPKPQLLIAQVGSLRPAETSVI